MRTAVSKNCSSGSAIARDLMPPMATRKFFAIALILLGGIIAGSAQEVMEPIVAEGDFTYIAEGADLADVLNAIGAATGQNIIVSPSVQGKVNGRFVNRDPEVLLRELESVYRLTTFRDGSLLYVYTANEMETAFIQLEFLSPERAIELLRELALYDAQYPVRTVETPPMVYVAGPPRYIENLRQVLTSAEERLRSQEVRREEVRYFPLKHAWAADVTLPLRDQDVEVPGVATLLQRLMSQQQDVGDNVPRDVFAGDGGRGASVSRVSPNAGGSSELAGATPTGLGGFGSISGAADLSAASPTQIRMQLDPDIRPAITADMRRNAVIVRDSALRMELYEDLIADLDIPVRLVEIQASIIDVNADLAMEWGLEAEISFEDQHNSGFGSIDTDPGTPGSGINVQAGELAASWLVLNDHVRFLAAIRALEGRGEARILSRPSLISYANLEAELRDDQTFSVRVAGQEDVELFTVTAGVQLRVTSSIIEPEYDDRERSIRLIVRIEDGDFEEATVDDLPIVRTSAINTQAVVHDDQSLLIGGYLREVQLNQRRDVPGLSKVPVLGGLFRSHEKGRQVMQRMFLLTPRVIELDASSTEPLVGRVASPDTERQLFDTLDQQLPEDRQYRATPGWTEDAGAGEGEEYSRRNVGRPSEIPAVGLTPSTSEAADGTAPVQSTPKPVMADGEEGEPTTVAKTTYPKAVPPLVASSTNPTSPTNDAAQSAVTADGAGSIAKRAESQLSVQEQEPQPSRNAQTRYTIQIGSFANRVVAEEYRKQVEAQTGKTVILFSADHGTILKACLGEYEDKYSALEACRELRAIDGFGDCFVRPLSDF